jgi:hypothetical protein
LKEYNSVLYKKGEEVRLKKGSIIFETNIERVSVSGELHTRDSIERSFGFGEVEWLQSN